MARARNIKHSTFTSESLADNTPIERLFFIGLWTLSDFQGNVEWKPRTIKIQLLPWDDCDIEKIAINLDQSGVIRFYSVQGKLYINIPGFVVHQNPHKNEIKKGTTIPNYSSKYRQAVDLEGLAINPDLIANESEKIGTDPADSCFLIPDSCTPISEPGYPHPGQRPEREKPTKIFRKPTHNQLYHEFDGRVPEPATEARNFLNHYESNGWKVGKTAMKSWPHAVTNWITRRKDIGNNNRSSQQTRPDRSERADAETRAHLDSLRARDGESVA